MDPRRAADGEDVGVKGQEGMGVTTGAGAA